MVDILWYYPSVASTPYLHIFISFHTSISVWYSISIRLWRYYSYLWMVIIMNFPLLSRVKWCNVKSFGIGDVLNVNLRIVYWKGRNLKTNKQITYHLSTRSLPHTCHYAFVKPDLNMKRKRRNWMTLLLQSLIWYSFIRLWELLVEWVLILRLRIRKVFLHRYDLRFWYLKDAETTNDFSWLFEWNGHGGECWRCKKMIASRVDCKWKRSQFKIWIDDLDKKC